ncbi:Mitochondrial carrier domain [Phytophthora cactorum]|nr:Mitochondrial carrier domain [Phytophthora cactorum]
MAALDEDWEEWTPEKGSFVNHMLAGSAAGVAEHVSIFPIDTVKTHMQCQHCPVNGKPIKLTATQTARKLVAEEGTFRLFRGVSTMLGASLPAHAVYFSVFEAAKKALGADTNTITPMASGSAGVIATVCHDLIMTPMDVVKQRLQLGYYNGVADCFKTVVMKHEGLRALYISFPTTLLMNLPYSMIMVSANETFKKILNPSGEMNVSAYIASGAAAGALVWSWWGLLSDVLLRVSIGWRADEPAGCGKDRLQTQSMMMTEEASCPSRTRCAQLQTRGVSITVPPSCSINGRPGIERAEPVLRRQYAGLMDALIQIKAQEGFAGFFRGVYPRLLVHAPSVAVSWTTFEVLKKTLDRMGAEDDYYKETESSLFLQETSQRTSASLAPTELRGQTSMVECSPGPQGGVASPGIDSTDNSVGNERALLGSQAFEAASSPPAQSVAHHSELFKGARLSRGSYPKRFMRSSSDSNIRGAVSPLPSTFEPHQGIENKLTKPCQKREVVLNMQKPTEESIVFLNASIQLMHLNGEARQRVRQLWTSVQRLGRENQISEAGTDLLYAELGNILKTMSAEKLEATKHLKSGRLVLLASSPASDPGVVGGSTAVKALFGARPTAQLMQCSLSEDQSKFEMTPVRQAPASSNSVPNPPASTLSRFAITSTASLMGMISDAFQVEPTTRVIRLQGCQVRRLVPKSPSSEATSGDVADDVEVSRAKIFHRFQLLVPYKTQMSSPMDGGDPTATSGALKVEADLDAETQVDEWVWALDRVCRFHLHRLERALREAPTIDRYRDTLQHHFPVCVSLSWLRNRLDQPTLQRRASANLSMIQIVKDLDRDKVLLDGQLFSAANPFEEYTMESDSVSEVVKYMVKKVLTFEQETTSQYRVPGATHQPSSPAHRFANNCEARALAFVERVLQGSSRTQSGGDIYDAISFFCQQEHVSICPVSQDARPVQMRITSDIPKGSFQVEVQVCMQFKVIELTPRSPTPASPSEAEDTSVLDSTAMDSPRDSLREWAVLEGTLSRQFTLGQLSAPGTVTITCI